MAIIQCPKGHANEIPDTEGYAGEQPLANVPTRSADNPDGRQIYLCDACQEITGTEQPFMVMPSGKSVGFVPGMPWPPSA